MTQKTLKIILIAYYSHITCQVLLRLYIQYSYSILIATLCSNIMPTYKKGNFILERLIASWRKAMVIIANAWKMFTQLDQLVPFLIMFPKVMFP